MLFSTTQFLYFFSVVFAIYWALPWPRVRVYLLLAASIYFYACWSAWLALLIVCSSSVDFLLARAMNARAAPRWRKGCLVVSIVANVGLLCYFKYANFFLHSLEAALNSLGASASLPVLRVI